MKKCLLLGNGGREAVLAEQISKGFELYAILPYANPSVVEQVEKSNGKYKYYWLYRVKFGIPAASLATKGDSITFSTPSIEGTVLCRNKPDANGKHPWKAEVTEGDTGVTAATINDWYNSVYEPTYATTSTQTSGK